MHLIMTSLGLGLDGFLVCFGWRAIAGRRGPPARMAMLLGMADAVASGVAAVDARAAAAALLLLVLACVATLDRGRRPAAALVLLAAGADNLFAPRAPLDSLLLGAASALCAALGLLAARGARRALGRLRGSRPTAGGPVAAPVG
jgi:hypothetical protein